VQKILVSGDNRFEDYDEPGRMMDYAVNRGVPAEDIQPDYAGRRTYDTCYRAKAIFQLDSAVLVTQGFHLPRALFTCRNLGVEAVGVSADLRAYHPMSMRWSTSREFLATLRALLDVVRQKPAPVLGEPIPIG
jgi:SanA protein